MTAWIREHIRTLTHLSGLTSAEAEALFFRVVRVELGERMCENPTYRLTYFYALNLISRMFPYVQFDPIVDEPLLILPWGSRFPLATEKPAEVTLVIGDSRSVKRDGKIATANCHDWKVYIDNPVKVDPQEPWNPVLGLVTACYAAARVVQVLLGDAVDQEAWRPFSILDLRQGTTKFDWSSELPLGEADLAGIGAVGSSFLYAVAAHNAFRGRLRLVDHDRVDLGNLGRYTFFDASEVGEFKTLAAKAKLEKLGVRLKVETSEKRFEKYFDEGYARDSSFRVAKLISAPDQRSTRRAFQGKLPQQMWDASTGPNQVIVHSNRFEKPYACTACIYPEIAEEDAHARHVAEVLNVALARVKSGDEIREADAEKISERYAHLKKGELIGKAFDSVFRALCSASELRTESGVVLAPFSFVSGLAGVLLYFELVKSSVPAVFSPFQDYNYMQINPLRMPNPEFRELRASRKGCMCQQEDVRALHQRIWNKPQ
jgi:molybdopterin/thiamine biosynthesis adenylyltransferase